MIAVSHAQKSFGDKHVFDNLSLCVPPHSIYAIVGPTGCGKSTLLNLIARLDALDSGIITASSPSRPGYMMQDPFLLPWRNLEENATLGIEVALGTKPRQANVRSYFQAVELWDDRLKYPPMASGGMKQRVALLRTLFLQPTLLLMDEPFTGLDFDIKLKVQSFLLAYRQRHDTTILWVTHDIEDAIAISDNVIVLSDKPTRVKAEFHIDLGLASPNPVEARKTAAFRDYFADIWDQLKYLDNGDAG